MTVRNSETLYKFQNAMNGAVEGIGNLGGSFYKTMLDTDGGGQMKIMKVVTETLKVKDFIEGGLPPELAHVGSVLGTASNVMSGIDLVVQAKNLKDTKVEFSWKNLTLVSGFSLSVVGFSQFLDKLHLINFGSVTAAVGKIPVISAIPFSLLGIIPSTANIMWKWGDLVAKDKQGRAFNVRKNAEIEVCKTIQSLWNVQNELVKRYKFGGEDFARDYLISQQDSYNVNLEKLRSMKKEADPEETADSIDSDEDFDESATPGGELTRIVSTEQECFETLYSDQTRHDEISVLAQSSLTDRFTKITEVFKANVPDKTEQMQKTFAFENKKWEVLRNNAAVQLAKPKYSIVTDIIKIASIALGFLVGVFTGYVWFTAVAMSIAYLASLAGVWKVMVGHYAMPVPEIADGRYLAELANAAPAQPAN